MKNKTKKLLAGLGLAAVFGVGGLGLTGCSVELSEEQVEKVMTVVDRSDVFMDETIDLLESSNSELDRKDIAKLYEYSLYKLKVNYGNIWDNMSVEFKQEFWEKKEQEFNFAMTYNFFKLGDLNVAYMLSNGTPDSSSYFDNAESESPTGEDPVPSVSQIRTFTYNVNSTFIPMLAAGNITEDTIVDYEVLENGDYRVYACDTIDLGDGEGSIAPAVMECIISKDGRLLSKTYVVNQLRSEAEGDVTTSTVTINVAYGTLNADAVQAHVNTINA